MVLCNPEYRSGKKINPSTRMIITMMTITMMMISLSRWRAIRSRVHSTYAILEFVRFSIPSLFANFSPIFVHIPRSIRFSPSCISNLLRRIVNWLLFLMEKGKKNRLTENYFSIVFQECSRNEDEFFFLFFFSDRTSEAKFVAAGTERSNQS